MLHADSRELDRRSVFAYPDGWNICHLTTDEPRDLSCFSTPISKDHADQTGFQTYSKRSAFSDFAGE